METAVHSAVQDPRFWAKTARDPRGFCRVWTGYRDRQGYGLVMRQAISTSPLLAHRYAWMLLNGPIPDGAVIRHRCDNPPCVEATHLLIGTQADNIGDRQRRGRHRPGRLLGERHPAHKLSDVDVVEIRTRFATGVYGHVLASEYGVHISTIYSITSRRGWKHVAAA